MRGLVLVMTNDESISAEALERLCEGCASNVGMNVRLRNVSAGIVAGAITYAGDTQFVWTTRGEEGQRAHEWILRDGQAEERDKGPGAGDYFTLFPSCSAAEAQESADTSERRRFSRFRDLNGSFNILHLDAKSGRAQLLTDRHGSRPLFIVRTPTMHVVAPSALMALKLAGLPVRLDENGVVEFLSLSFCTGDRTVYENVIQAPPASLIELGSGRMWTEEYWQPAFEQGRPEWSKKDFKKAFVTAFRRAVAANACGSVGLSLSSGLDSRTLFGFLPDEAMPIPTFTYGTADCYDVIFADRLAKLRACPNHHVPIHAQELTAGIPVGVAATSGLLPGSMFYHWPLVREMAAILDAELCGAGGDVYTGAYLSRAAFRARNDEDVISLLLARRRFVNLSQSNGKSLVCARLARSAEEILRASFRRCLALCNAEHPVNRLDFFHITGIDRKNVRSGDIVRRLALDVRTPFYDRDVVDVLLRAKPEWRRGQSVYLEIIRDELPLLAGVGRDLTGVPVDSPLAVASLSRKFHRATEALCRCAGMDPGRFVRRRRPFDWAANLRNGMADFMESACLHPRLLDNSLLDADGIRRAVHRHLRSRADRSVELGVLMTLSFVLAGEDVAVGGNLDVRRHASASRSATEAGKPKMIVHGERI